MNYHYDNWLECEGTFEVTGCEQENDFYWVRTNDTIFYVEGGGMEKDTGTINGIEVEDIRYQDGCYYHKMRSPVSGEAVMKVDVGQRIWKAQIHSASHLICGLINRKYHAKTIAFFTHEDISGCEMEFETFDEAVMKQIEREVNDYVLQDLPIHIVYPTAEEARAHVPEEKLDHEELRAAVIGDIDYNMCGCIHVPSLRYLQSIKLLSFERTSRGYKIYFVCGDQLLKTYGAQVKILDACAKSLSVAQKDICEGLEKLHQDVKESKERETDWRQKVIDYRVKELGNSADTYLAMEIDDLDIKTFQTLCSTLVINYPKGVFFVCRNQERCHVIIARNASLEFKANEIFRAVAAKFQLRGGGNPGMAQGGGVYQAEILAELRQLAQSM